MAEHRLTEIEIMAAVAYNAMIEFTALAGAVGADELIRFDDLDDSARRRVTQAAIYTIENPTHSAEVRHRRNAEELRRCGYVYDAQHSEARRTSPWVREWAALAVEDRQRMRMFVAIVRSLQ